MDDAINARERRVGKGGGEDWYIRRATVSESAVPHIFRRLKERKSIEIWGILPVVIVDMVEIEDSFGVFQNVHDIFCICWP